MHQTDNKKIFEQLYADYHPMVLQMCIGYARGDLDLAKDLTQEIFINSWNALDTFKGTSGYKTWIYRVTVNTCLKYIRDVKLKNTSPIDEIEHKLEDRKNDGAEEKYKRLYRAIGELEETDRLVIMMVLNDLSYEEIAKVIGIKEGNLRVKIHRIKSTLKKLVNHE